MRSEGIDTTEMYPDKFYKDDVIEHLQLDYDVVLYFGHGIRGAWSGYNRITIKDLRTIKSKHTQKTIMSLSCYSMCDTQKDEKSFGDHIIDNSLANCVLGYNDKIKYESNLQFMNLLLDNYLTEKHDNFRTYLSAFLKDKYSLLELPLKLLMI
ncbi:MAG: C25 family cysteine peptidase [Bacteroidota bacterium]